MQPYKLKNTIYKILILSIINVSYSIAQYHPSIQNYTPEIYQAGNQNWKIDRDSSGRLYVANNFGLLEFDGLRWNLYATPNNTIMRAVGVNKNIVYTGAYMDFGYWLRQENGKLVYTSLANRFDFDMIEDEQFWSILSHKEFILFQSLDRLVIYNQINNSLNTITPKNGVVKAFVNDDGVFFQDNKLTLYKIVNENSKVYLTANQLMQNPVVGMTSTLKGELFVTRDNGLLLHNNGIITVYNSKLSRDLSRDVIYSFTKSENGQLILGSVKNGVYVLSSDGVLLQHINADEGLHNNTVLTVFADTNGVWLGLDDGLAYVATDTPIQKFNNNQNFIGTVYATQIFNDFLYVGTNQGLYYKKYNSDELLRPIVGMEGQVWSLQIINNALMCGHDSGAFLVNQNKARKLYGASGIWLFKTMNDTEFIAGAYDGLHLFKKQNGAWLYQHHIENFTISSRYFERINPQEFLVSHEYKGVFRLVLNSEKTRVLTTTQVPNAPISLYSSMTSFQGDVYYFSKNGFFGYDAQQNRFVKNDKIAQLFNDDNFTTGKMVLDREKYLWLFERNNLVRLAKGALSDDFVVSKYPLAYDARKTNTGFENISHIVEDKYLLGTSNSFFRFDTSKIKSSSPKIALAAFTARNKAGREQSISLHEEVSLEADFNSFTASFYLTNNAIYDTPRFQYRLDGYSETWSAWTESATTSFSNLKFGTYTLSVRAMVNDDVSDVILGVPFSIKRPYYFSNIALLVYSIFMFGLFRLINIRYTYYYRREQEKLINENQRKIDLMQLRQNEEIMRIKNEQLEDNIEQKNKELAISTMAFIKKNQFMNSLLIDLEPAANDPTVSRVLRTIKRSLKNDDDWEFFEQAFDNADKDFLKRLKQKHEALTNHDLKLCAYLRLNLSSKEIAPLLSISVKSVDIKRYRLRKKMDLEHNQNLTEYILSL